MKFRPSTGYIHIDPITEEEVNGNFQWAKQSGDLTAVKVIYGENHLKDDVLVVISTMIQEFEFKKNKFKICPTSAVVGTIMGE